MYYVYLPPYGGKTLFTTVDNANIHAIADYKERSCVNALVLRNCKLNS